eukprot:scaffold5047_cov127-Skeletonema_menzelii.AAC.13
MGTTAKRKLTSLGLSKRMRKTISLYSYTTPTEMEKSNESKTKRLIKSIRSFRLIFQAKKLIKKKGKGGYSTPQVQTKRAKIDELSMRKDENGASSIIKNFLPFLQLEGGILR